ncbi:MAG: transcriptional regulator [Legionellales bacterium]|nr:transcriptional regulator [Legionellales bacterium]
MKVKAKIQKWGNGLALRVAGLMRDIPHFEEGTKVEVEIYEDGFVVKKYKPVQGTVLPFSEEQLLADLTPELAHSDLLAQPLMNEWEHKE